MSKNVWHALVWHIIGQFDDTCKPTACQAMGNLYSYLMQLRVKVEDRFLRFEFAHSEVHSGLKYFGINKFWDWLGIKVLTVESGSVKQELIWWKWWMVVGHNQGGGRMVGGWVVDRFSQSLVKAYQIVESEKNWCPEWYFKANYGVYYCLEMLVAIIGVLSPAFLWSKLFHWKSSNFIPVIFTIRLPHKSEIPEKLDSLILISESFDSTLESAPPLNC